MIGVNGRLGVWLMVVMLLGAGCDRGGSEPSEGEESAQKQQQTAEETSPPSPDAEAGGETGGEASTSKADWKAKVEAALEEGEEEVAAQKAEEAAKTCSFFPDSCDEGKACFSTAEGKHRCAPFNPNKQAGDVCRRANACNRGQQCVGGRPGRCMRICDPSGGEGADCGSGRTCVVVYTRDGQKMPWGACQRNDDKCTGWPEDDCRVGENCYPTPVGRRCQGYEDTAQVGDRCERDPTRCNFGQACVDVAGVGWRCMDKCDDDHPCGVGECRPITDRSYGFCGGGGGEEGPPRRQGRIRRDGSDLKGWSD